MKWSGFWSEYVSTLLPFTIGFVKELFQYWLIEIYPQSDFLKFHARSLLGMIDLLDIKIHWSRDADRRKQQRRRSDGRWSTATQNDRYIISSYRKKSTNISRHNLRHHHFILPNPPAEVHSPRLIYYTTKGIIVPFNGVFSGEDRLGEVMCCDGDDGRWWWVTRRIARFAPSRTDGWKWIWWFFDV